MDYTEDSLMRLRNSLPWGYAEKLRVRMLEKHDRRLTANSIRRHLSLKNADTQTISEAILLKEEALEERKAKALSLAKRK